MRRRPRQYSELLRAPRFFNRRPMPISRHYYRVIARKVFRNLTRRFGASYTTNARVREAVEEPRGEDRRGQNPPKTLDNRSDPLEKRGGSFISSPHGENPASTSMVIRTSRRALDTNPSVPPSAIVPHLAVRANDTSPLPLFRGGPGALNRRIRRHASMARRPNDDLTPATRLSFHLGKLGSFSPPAFVMNALTRSSDMVAEMNRTAPSTNAAPKAPCSAHVSW